MVSETKDRPRELSGETHKFPTGCGNIYVTVNKDESGVVFEIIAKLGKSGGCAAAQLEALTRAISIGLRSGVSLQEYEHTFKGIRCNNMAILEGIEIWSCADAIAKVIKEYLPEDRRQ